MVVFVPLEYVPTIPPHFTYVIVSSIQFQFQFDLFGPFIIYKVNIIEKTINTTSSAFDTLDIELFLKKLTIYGADDVTLQLPLKPIWADAKAPTK